PNLPDYDARVRRWHLKRAAKLQLQGIDNRIAKILGVDPAAEKYASRQKELDNELQRDMAPVRKRYEKGVRWQRDVDFHANPLSSWSSDTATAFRFTGSGRAEQTYSAMAYAEVPVERILSNPFTGMGCLGEREFVMTGGEMPIFVKVLRRVQSKHLKHQWSDAHAWLTAEDEFSGTEKVRQPPSEAFE
ncbi:unnamed protein product, partial [marine sediment metagenome]